MFCRTPRKFPLRSQKREKSHLPKEKIFSPTFPIRRFSIITNQLRSTRDILALSIPELLRTTSRFGTFRMLLLLLSLVLVVVAECLSLLPLRIDDSACSRLSSQDQLSPSTTHDDHDQHPLPPYHHRHHCRFCQHRRQC